jgi:hypothetical protein
MEPPILEAEFVDDAAPSASTPATAADARAVLAQLGEAFPAPIAACAALWRVGRSMPRSLAVGGLMGAALGVGAGALVATYLHRRAAVACEGTEEDPEAGAWTD